MQSECDLYGGALSVVLPKTAQDVSVVRHIPDNQEVFVHPNTDQSLIIEIMEMADPQLPDIMAIETHFKDLATANGAEEDSQIIAKEQVSQENYAMEHTASSSHHATPTYSDRWSVEDFRRAMSSLRIVRTSIFGEENMED